MTQELQFLLLIAIIIFVSKYAGHLAQRDLNQPVVFGEILAGLVLGPTVFNIFGWPLFSHSAEWLRELVNLMAHIGVLLLMFIAGLETNLDEMRKVGKSAFVTAILGVAAPLGMGFLFSRLFGLGTVESIFIGVVLTATSVSISAQTLMEINQLRSKEGLTIMGAAVIDDVLGIIILSFVVAFSAVKGDGGAEQHAALTDTVSAMMAGALNIPAAFVNIAMIVIFMGAFFVLAVLIGSRWFNAVLDYADRLHASHAIPATALLLILLFAVGSEYIGHVAAITGAYIVGVFMARTRHCKPIERSIHPFTYAFFVPIFFMSIGLGANARELAGGNWGFVIVIVVVAIISKIVGCAIGARATGCNMKEATRIGIGMVSRGEVGLIVSMIGLNAGIIGEGEYATMVIMVLATTVVTPILLRLSFPRVKETQTDIYESVVGIEGDEAFEGTPCYPDAAPSTKESEV